MYIYTHTSVHLQRRIDRYLIYVCCDADVMRCDVTTIEGISIHRDQPKSVESKLPQANPYIVSNVIAQHTSKHIRSINVLCTIYVYIYMLYIHMYTYLYIYSTYVKRCKKKIWQSPFCRKTYRTVTCLRCPAELLLAAGDIFWCLKNSCMVNVWYMYR